MYQVSIQIGKIIMLKYKRMNQKKLTIRDMGQVALSWIEHVKSLNKGLYSEMMKSGELYDLAKEKEEKYHKDVEEMKDLYPPGGAEEIARRELYPELYD